VGTQQLRFNKGVEHLYYALLYSTDPAYQDNAEVWRSWLDIGFHLAVKVTPRGTRPQDALHVRYVSNGKAPEFHGAGGNPEVLKRLQQLIQDVDSLRATLAGMDADRKAQALVENPQVNTQLIAPLTASLNKAKLRPDEIDQFMSMIKRGLLALTHDDVTHATVSLN
jgi:hypothetical protein